MKKVSKGIKVTPADRWFSKCVRIRSNWICENCSVNLEHFKADLHCSHFIPRGHLSTRYHPDNAFAHCHKCHKKLGGDRWGGGNVAEFTEFYDKKLGPVKREFVRRLAQYPFNYHQFYLKDISDFYRLSFKKMDEMRKAGEQRRIEFLFFPGSLELNTISKQLEQELFKKGACND